MIYSRCSAKHFVFGNDLIPHALAQAFLPHDQLLEFSLNTHQVTSSARKGKKRLRGTA